MLHVALDYIEQLYLRGYKDWEIRDRIRYGKKKRLYYLLKSAGLDDFIDKNLEKILRDIKDSKSPSKVMKEGQERYRKILNMLKEQDISAIVINGTPYPPSTGIRKLQSILKRGDGQRLVWSVGSTFLGRKRHHHSTCPREFSTITTMRT